MLVVYCGLTAKHRQLIFFPQTLVSTEYTAPSYVGEWQNQVFYLPLFGLHRSMGVIPGYVACSGSMISD